MKEPRISFAYRGWHMRPFRRFWIGTTMVLGIGPVAVFVGRARR